MKASEIDDCDICPLLNTYCNGGMTSSPGGEPIEPPCVCWDSDTDLDEFMDEIKSSQYAHEEYLDRQYKEEKEQEKKQKIKTQRAKESRWHVRKETAEIKRLQNRINGNQSLMSFAHAMSITNSILEIKDSRPDVAKSIFEVENENYKKEIEEISLVKKIKLKELRTKRLINGTA